MKGRVEEAIRAYEAAARIAPKDARTLGDLGTALLADNQVDDAIAVLKRAVRRSQARHLALQPGLRAPAEARLEGAIAEFREAHSSRREAGSAWINLATALAPKGAIAPKRQRRSSGHRSSIPAIRGCAPTSTSCVSSTRAGKPAAPGGTKPPPREGRC